MTPRKLLTVAFFLVVLGVGYYSMNAAPVTSDHGYTYQGGLEWHEDPEEAFEAAETEGKPVLVYYWTTWCTYCDEYDDDHYRDDAVREELDEFVLLAINIDDPGPGEPLAHEHEVNYPPQHVIVTPDGEPVEDIGGYVEREEFLSVLERVTGEE